MFKEVTQGFGNARYVTPAKMQLDEEFMGYYLGTYIHLHNRKIHCLREENGGDLRIASSTALDEFIDTLQIGNLVKIQFKGQIITKRGSRFNQFKFFLSDKTLEPEVLEKMLEEFTQVKKTVAAKSPNTGSHSGHSSSDGYSQYDSPARGYAQPVGPVSGQYAQQAPRHAPLAPNQPHLQVHPMTSDPTADKKGFDWNDV